MKKQIASLTIFLLLSMMFFGVINFAKAGSNSDVFGYTFKDSNTPGGPTYNWIEINDTGTQLIPTSGSNWAPQTIQDVNIGFSFNYYGTDYSKLTIRSCGLLTFEPSVFDGFIFQQDERIGNSPSVDGFIMPFGEQLWAYNYLNPDSSAVLCETLGTSPNRQFIVEWQNVVGPISNISIGSNQGITFEAILFEDSNNILFQYNDTIFSDSSWWTQFSNYGGQAMTGIEDSSGNIGLEYSYYQPILNQNLAVLFTYPKLAISPNLYVSLNAPPAVNRGDLMTYTVSYCNLGSQQTEDTNLKLTIPLEVTFYSADNGVFDPVTRTVTWFIGNLNAYPSGYGTQTVTVQVPINLPLESTITSTAQIWSSVTETTYDDNSATSLTKIIGFDLPAAVSVQADQIVSDPVHTPIVQNREPVTFTFDDSTATSVDISIQLSDGGQIINGAMVNSDSKWTYTLIFGTRTGEATATFTAHEPLNDVTQTAHFEVVRIDPAGYIYDINSGLRISEATVWLQTPNGKGGWINAPTGNNPAIMDPDINPQITGTDGRYQWNTLPGIYRVQVEAPGYYPTNSIAVTVPPPVTDLNVGMVKIPLPQDNSPPTVKPITCSSTQIQINNPVTFTSSFTDSDTYDTHSAIWQWSDGYISRGTVIEASGIGSVTGGRTFTSAGIYTETLTLAVTDSNSGHGESSIELTIVVNDNSPPIIQQISCPVAPIQVNTPIAFSAGFNDINTYDSHSAIWTWSDGYRSTGTISETRGVGQVIGNRIFASAGVYAETLTLTITDNKGGSSQSTIDLYVVVYDPNAGFVTGGGWIDSPAGAYTANPALTGKANFGFVSQYKKGANVPTGNTEFDFHTISLTFHSTTYDWLVVGGAKAQFKGTGTINGAGSYGFMLTAIDGQLLGSKHVDTFRIKIWDTSTGAILYDNQMGVSDSSDPTTAISGGSIIIHK
jgi:hypothetical protein